MDDPETKTALQACLENADELLIGAEALLDRGLPRLAYHLGALALEEVGKSSILGMQKVAEDSDRELPAWIARSVDDHVRKLFWAIWGPSIGRETITGAQIEENRGLARRIHEKRLRGLYVDASATNLSSPMDSIPAEEAVSLLRFTRACVEMQRPMVATTRPLSDVERLRQEWFFRATEDPERRKVVMGNASMEKLKELENISDWVEWLQETFDRNDAEAKAALEREIQLQQDLSAPDRARWRTTVRLHSTSHSMRPKTLNKLSEGLELMSFRPVPGKHGQLLVDLDATGDTDVRRLWTANLFLVRRLVMALNVASLGYFWFHEPLDGQPKQSGRFYESMRNFETGAELDFHRTPPLQIEYGPQRRVLGDDDLRRWVLCMGLFMKRHGVQEQYMCDRYLEGLAMIAKSDVQMAFEVSAVVAFYVAIRTAVELYEPGAEMSLRERLHALRVQSVRGLEAVDLDRLCDVGESVNTGKGIPHAMTMNDAGVMKLLCDVYLIHMSQAQSGNSETGVDGAPA